MTITVLQLLTAVPSLRDLAAQPHKGLVAFKIRRLLNILQPDIAAATHAKDILFTETNSVPLGSGRELRPECVASVLADPLFGTPLEVQVVPLRPEDLMNATISPASLEALGPLFCDEEV